MLLLVSSIRKVENFGEELRWGNLTFPVTLLIMRDARRNNEGLNELTCCSLGSRETAARATPT